MKCRGILILGGSQLDESADHQFQVFAECDDYAGCGFVEHLAEHDDDPTWGITSDEFAEVQARHLAHAGGAA